MKGPALSKTAAFCMLLLIASLRVVDAARDRLKVPSGYGFDFFLDRFDNGRSNPYRVTFYNSGFKSVYKFNQDGFVKNIEADQETYRITYTENGILETVTGSSTRRNLDERGLEENADMPTSILKSAASADDESLTTTPTHYGDHVEVDSSRAQQKLPCGLHEGSAGMATYLRNTPSLATRRLYACEDCDMTWDTVCTKGVETVCNLEGYGSPFLSAGVASIDVLCNILGGICSELSGSDVCDGECAAECYPPLRITLEWTGDEGLSGGQVPSLDLYVMEPGGMTASSTNSETATGTMTSTRFERTYTMLSGQDGASGGTYIAFAEWWEGFAPVSWTITATDGTGRRLQTAEGQFNGDCGSTITSSSTYSFSDHGTSRGTTNLIYIELFEYVDNGC